MGLIVASLSVNTIAQDCYSYNGPALDLQLHKFRYMKIGDLQSDTDKANTSFEMWDDYAVCIQNEGNVAIYEVVGEEAKKRGQFSMAGYTKSNRLGSASFGTQFFAKSDKFPLLFIGEAQSCDRENTKATIFVERLNNNMQSSTLVATIHFNYSEKQGINTLLWAIDRQNNCLYGFANTSFNQHRVLKFKLPQISTKKSKKPQTIVLTNKDLIENYLLEDTCPHFKNKTGKGLLVLNGLLFIVSNQPLSMLHVWDLNRHVMRNSIDLGEIMQNSATDCAGYYGNLMIQSQNGFYKIIFDE